MNEQPAVRKTATVCWQRDKLSIGTTATGHALIVDAPRARGGNGWGFKGGELMLLGLGACFATVLIEAAGRREIDITELAIEVSARDAHQPFRYADFEIRVRLSSSANNREVERLLKIAERGCQVSNTLRSEAGVSLVLERKEKQARSAPGDVLEC